VLSKCANPECSEQFRYLHQGKLFCLTPTPEALATERALPPSLYERFGRTERAQRIWGRNTERTPSPVRCL
jgi:hypothetical protein